MRYKHDAEFEKLHSSCLHSFVHLRPCLEKQSFINETAQNQQKFLFSVFKISQIFAKITLLLKKSYPFYFSFIFSQNKFHLYNVNDYDVLIRLNHIHTATCIYT